MRLIVTSLAVLGISCLAGCDTGPKSAVGFSLPDGNADAGKQTFVEIGCHACHSTDDVEALGGSVEGAVNIPLGGETTHIKTYGELVTSIINPSHRVARRDSPDQADASGESRMATFNDIMTVTQLIDLVAYVQSQYTLSPYKHTTYPVYWVPEKAGEK